MWIMNKTTMLKGMKEVVNKLLNIIKENEKNEGKNKINTFENSIELNEITFSYDDERLALDNVSLTIEKNKKYAIVGASGSGKSTILKLILGYYDDYKGNIKFDSNEYSILDKNSINNQISMIHQNVYMFDKTLKDNIILGKDFNINEINKALKNSGVNEFLMVLPQGIDSFIGENGNTLSGGQRQRVAVARSFIQNTLILLLDEGTSALDTKTAYEIENSVLNMEDLTVVTVTHKLNKDILSRYDEIIVMDKGKVIEKGNFTELLQNKGEFNKLYCV